jgi:cyanophycinase
MDNKGMRNTNMRDRMLFLFGGNPSLIEANQEFITAAGGNNSRIALLIVNTPGYQKYIPAYTNVWRQIGISAYSIIVPDDQGQLDFDTTEKVLLNATGIYIGGGDTRTYLKLYASDPIKGMLKTCYQNGIPIAGC